MRSLATLAPKLGSTWRRNSYRVVAPERAGDLVTVNGVFRTEKATTIRYRLPDARGSMACGLEWFEARFELHNTLDEATLDYLLSDRGVRLC